MMAVRKNRDRIKMVATVRDIKKLKGAKSPSSIKIDKKRKIK